MNPKNKFLYIFLIIVTFGFILIYWKKRFRQTKPKNYLSKETKLSFNFDVFVSLLGGKENIKSVSATQKILKINFLDKAKIAIPQLKNLDGITGVAIQSKTISFVVGNVAKHIEHLINEVN
ncbi:hypothetical protein ACWXVM_02660 [Mycoplasma sp. 2261]